MSDNWKLKHVQKTGDSAADFVKGVQTRRAGADDSNVGVQDVGHCAASILPRTEYGRQGRLRRAGAHLNRTGGIAPDHGWRGLQPQRCH